MYLSDSRVTNISNFFSYKMAPKTSWHRYGTKLCYCHPMYSLIMIMLLMLIILPVTFPTNAPASRSSLFSVQQTYVPIFCIYVVLFVLIWASSVLHTENNFSILFVLVSSVLWRCWLGGRKGMRPVKNWVVGCWRGYLSGLAYGPVDASATHCLLLQ